MSPSNRLASEPAAQVQPIKGYFNRKKRHNSTLATHCVVVVVAHPGLGWGSHPHHSRTPLQHKYRHSSESSHSLSTTVICLRKYNFLLTYHAP